MPRNCENTIPADAKSKALAISFSVLLLLAVSAISLSFWSSSESSHDAIAINLAGRQRMLSQRIEKDLLKLRFEKLSSSDTSVILQDLSHSDLLFDNTLRVLKNGNFVAQDGKAFTVAATQSKEFIALVNQAHVIWAPMQAALIPVTENSAKPSSADIEKILFLVIRDNERLLQLMNRLTNQIEDAAYSKADTLKTLEALAIGLILVNFGFILFYFRRQMTLLTESKLLSMRIMENASTAIIVINQKGEIELCNHAAEHMFGYSTGKLTGENFKALLDEPYFMEIGMRRSGEHFALDINLNEIPIPGHKIFVASLYDKTEQKLKEEQLNHLAYHDALTELPNRLLFLDRLMQAIARAHRNKEWIAILFIDLDRFKQVNDSLGHAIGDLLLQAVASRLKNCLREGDTLARLGGDEFTMIIDANDVNSCSTISQKILSALNQEFYLDGQHIQISGSIGASLYPNDSCDIQELLHYADLAMYRVKAKGGNNCCKFSEISPIEAVQS